RRRQAALDAYLHDAVVVDGIRPAMKPDKGRVVEVAQPKSFASGCRVTLGRGEHELVPRDLQLSDISARHFQAEDKSRIELAGPNGFHLLIRQHGMQFQLRVRLLASEAAKRVWHDPVPGKRLDKSESQSSGPAGSHPLGAYLRSLDLLQ